MDATNINLDTPTISLDNLDGTGSVTVCMRGPNAREVANHHQSVGDSNWECDGDDFAYAVVSDSATLVAELEDEDYIVDDSEYCSPE